jgi:transcriptional regulator with XRE-family HTH domain
MKPQNTYWAANIRFLRKRKKLSQEMLAQAVGISRAKLNGLENGVTQNPTLGDLVQFSNYFKISVDTLIRTELAKLSEFKLRQLEAGNEAYVTGRNIRILPVTVDKDNHENLEYVPVKAKMGYKAGYNDPEYIASLPKFSLPNLSRNKTYRIFPSTGESMLPLKPGTDFITEYVENWETLKDTPCVLILQSEGADFVFKYATYQKAQRCFILRSLNEEEYAPYSVPADEVLEIWKYHKHITDELPEKEPSLQQIAHMLKELRAELTRQKKNLH